VLLGKYKPVFLLVGECNEVISFLMKSVSINIYRTIKIMWWLEAKWQDKGFMFNIAVALVQCGHASASKDHCISMNQFNPEP
jgi:hypothetical protein